jgi:sulfatase modifying factor 1
VKRCLWLLFCLPLFACPAPPPTQTPTFTPTDAQPQPQGLVLDSIDATVSAAGEATVQFRTSSIATAVVNFGQGDFSRTAQSPAGTQHAVSLGILSEGTYIYKVSATAGSETVTEDNAGSGFSLRVAKAPIISGLAANVAANKVTITWTTDVPSTSLVEAGFNAYDLLSVDDPKLVTSHSLELTVSTPGVYKYRVVSIDAQGDQAQQDNRNFEVTQQNTEPLGTLANPIVIGAATLPTSYSDNSRSTLASPSNAIDTYTPATQNEKGPEYVYTFTITQAATLTASVSCTPPVDIDIHLLGTLDASSRTQTLLGSLATMRNNSTISNISLAAGTYYLVADTFGTDASKAGAYSLSVQLSGQGQTQACTASTRPTPNGVPVEVDNQNGCPPGMLVINNAYCIDQYEAMLVGLDASNNPFSWSPYSNPGTQKTKALSVANKVPQGYINKTQAKAACLNAGKRLCSASEWMRACRGPQSFTYPYGNVRQPGVCNDARAQHPAVEYFGPSEPNPFSKIDHPCINQLPNSLDRTGENTGCESVDQPFDMMGNLHEWIEDKTANGRGIFKGGYYVDTKINGNGCLYQTTAHVESHWDYSTGFRCCADL